MEKAPGYQGQGALGEHVAVSVIGGLGVREPNGHGGQEDAG